MSETVNRLNILAIQQYSKETRDMFRELEAKTKIISTLIGRIDVLELQVNNLLVAVHSNRGS